MLSRRNFVMMLTMVFVVLVLFLSSVVLKEHFNDYDVNHAAETAHVEKKKPSSDTVGQPASAGRPVWYFGTTDNGFYRAIEEWAGYRKCGFRVFLSLGEAEASLAAEKEPEACLLIDGELLAAQPESAANTLIEYVKRGGIVIFYRMPPYRVIEGCTALQSLLGIQKLRGESVSLREIRLYSGFLLGGETHYSFEGREDPDLADLERKVPWYDISSCTKSYMVGFLGEEEKNALGVTNEDMPAIIWRSNMGTGSVFAVNGDYMKGETALGLLDAMLYEAEEYALYPVVNAQNLCFAGFPDLTVENEAMMAEVYGMTTQQFCRDILWPTLVAVMEKDGWKGTAFLSVKQSDASTNAPNPNDLIDYLKFFNEEMTEAGVCLGRVRSDDIWASAEDEWNTLESWGIRYLFAGGYVRRENKDRLPTLLGREGKVEYFRDIRTIVGEYETDQQILHWLTDTITLQNATADAYEHSDRDSLRLKSLETALGYSNILVDIYRVLWLESWNDAWEKVAEKMTVNVDTYWKPFSAFDKTTISQSDSRVRSFLNGSVESARSGEQISIQTKDYSGESYLLLRTHGETPVSMTGGTWKEVEKDAYLLRLESAEASVILSAGNERFYQD